MSDTRPWTNEDKAWLLQMKGPGKKYSYKEIARKLGRTPEAVESKYKKLTNEPQRAPMMTYTRAEIVAPETYAERDQRRAISHSSITAACFGDPLPGYSALDQLRAEGRAI